MIFITYNPTSGELIGTSNSRFHKEQLEVEDGFFSEYSQDCWEVTDEGLALKADADAIKADLEVQRMVTAEPEYCTVSPVDFKLLFTSPERVAAKSLRTTDPVIEDFYEIIDDPRLTKVDFTKQSVRDAIKYLLDQLVSMNIVTSENRQTRYEQIVTGEFI